MNDFNIYDVLDEYMPQEQEITDCYASEHWTAVETPSGMGIVLTTQGFDCRRFAAINAFYNHGEMWREPFEKYYTDGVDFTGKTVGVVGHLGGIGSHHGHEVKKLYYFDIHPKTPEDLPPELEDEILPQCDIAVITGSSIVNQTLPHLLELCRNAYVILTGPSVPRCPALLDCGIDRLAGMCVTDVPGLRKAIQSNTVGNPYPFGEPFIISK